ncbi:50S ribosomal protein L1 [Patescibacteria group bacterium]|nr:50S ribosomal protein L1 [Patescibacteria group bacterium]
MRSKRYQEVRSKIDQDKKYSLDEAIEIVKANTSSQFDETIELHVQLGTNPRKTEQQVRGAVVLPHGGAKKRKILAIVPPDQEAVAKKAGADLAGGAKIIEKIKKEKSCSFDLVVAHPGLMSELAQIAKILGPQGLMPSPKTETIGEDIEDIIKSLRSGKIAFKNDAGANLHQALAKVSWDQKKIKENIEAYLNEIKKKRPAGIKGNFIKNVFVSSTMGPAIKIIVS